MHDGRMGCVANQDPESENRIVLLAGGGEMHVENVRLLLYVNDRSTEVAARERLSRLGDELTRRALNRTRPEIRAAILKGKPGEWGTDGTWVIHLERNEWSTGKGYDMRLVLLMAGTDYPGR
jgi:hypothetical protein